MGYNFKNGDVVIDIYGRKGVITSIELYSSDGAQEQDQISLKVSWDYRPEGIYYVCDNDNRGLELIHSIGEIILNPYDVNKARKEKKLITKEIKKLKKQRKFLLDGIRMIEQLSRPVVNKANNGKPTSNNKQPNVNK